MPPTEPLYQAHLSSPVGRLQLIATDTALVAVLWENDNPTRVPLRPLQPAPNHPLLAETERQLCEYFAGQRRTFTLPLAPRGTPFQQQVWAALQSIPYGETRTYGQLAHQLNNPKATRAIGAANGRNPLSILIPCHRVIGSTGHLTGFAGGLQAKTHLLHLETASERLF